MFGDIPTQSKAAYIPHDPQSQTVVSTWHNGGAKENPEKKQLGQENVQHVHWEKKHI